MQLLSVTFVPSYPSGHVQLQGSSRTQFRSIDFAKIAVSLLSEGAQQTQKKKEEVFLRSEVRTTTNTATSTIKCSGPISAAFSKIATISTGLPTTRAALRTQQRQGPIAKRLCHPFPLFCTTT